MNKIINYLLISDIHLGHNINKTEDIIANLDIFFSTYHDKIKDVDYIFIAGDVFDRLLSNGSRESILIYGWLSRLLTYSRKYGIKLRILEGTPSHDRKQVKQFIETVSPLELKDVDFKYFDRLDIEIDEETGLSILYIPDEWRPTAKEVYDDVKEKLKEYNLEKVDVVVMHGAFKYQIPGIESEAFHDMDDYLSITNYTVNCGHVHDMSQYDRILVPGSFDRLTHADEGQTKGGYLVTLIPENKFKYDILINKHALCFKTIYYTDMEELKKELEDLNKKHRKCHVRIIVTDNVSLTDTIRELSYNYQNLVIKTQSETKKKEQENKTKKIERKIITLDKNTLRDLVLEEIKEKDIDPSITSLLMDELESLL